MTEDPQHRAWRVTEPIHAMVYFVPEAPQRYGELGVAPGDGYFASRAAALGAVGPAVVTATFYNFKPALVAQALPAVWRVTTPAAMLAARLAAADAALARGLGAEVLESPEVAEAAALARRAAEAATDHPQGRALFAAHAELAWPDLAHLVLWHAQMLLREFRGDGHVAALLAAGLSGLESIVLHAASGQIDGHFLRSTRGWRPEEWAAAADGLRSRGLIDGDEISERGRELRAGLEETTPVLGEEPTILNPGTAAATVGQSGGVTKHPRHPAAWWAQFPEVSEKFDAAVVTEGLSDAIIPKIPSPLLRREAEIAAEVVVLHLNKVASPELARRAVKATDRLVATVERLTDRSTAEDAGTTEAYALCHALEGRWGEAASEAEPAVGTQPLLRIFVSALRLERFDTTLAVRLLRAGHRPDAAIQSGLIVGKYMWWPDWLIKIVTERALAGRLDAETIAALDRCAYAELSPAQARMARRLLNGEAALVDASAHRLEGLGEGLAAAKLREGDLSAVALAARLIPI